MKTRLLTVILVSAFGVVAGCGSDATDPGTSTGGSGNSTASAGLGGGGGAGASGGGGAGGSQAGDLTVDAGPDQSIAAPETGATLTGSAHDGPNRKITYAWTQTAGVTATIADPTAASTKVTGMLPGKRTFLLTATDDQGHQAKDSVDVTITSTGKLHYVATTGSDTTGDGSKAKPWATIAHACGAVTDPDDTIHVVAGTYTETKQCVLAPRINLEGEGKQATHVFVTYAQPDVYHGAFQLESATEGTNGDQSISNLWIDGGAFVGFNAVIVRARSNVTIHDVKFTNFQASAVSYNGRLVGAMAPATYATGNQFYKNEVKDCSDRAKGGGVLGVFGQVGLLVYANDFDQTGRPTGQNGNVIGAVNGYNRGLKYYDNKSHKPSTDGNSWNFVIESWYDFGGMEIYGNTFTGGGDAIDVGYGGGVKGDYPYSWYVHDNLFELPAPQDVPATFSLSMGVQFECAATDAVISHNHFKNTPVGVQLLLSHMEATDIERISVHNNLFEDMGYLTDSYGSFMVNVIVAEDQKVNGLFVDNNTMVAGPMAHARAGLFLRADSGTITDVHFRNNIVENVVTYGYLTFDGKPAGTIDAIFSQNNITHGNYKDDATFDHGTETRGAFTDTGNITSDPMLDASFHLKAGSPAIGAGVDVGYGKDIGAFPH